MTRNENFDQFQEALNQQLWQIQQLTELSQVTKDEDALNDIRFYLHVEEGKLKLMLSKYRHYLH
jgi:hypothetical protein